MIIEKKGKIVDYFWNFLFLFLFVTFIVIVFSFYDSKSLSGMAIINATSYSDCRPSWSCGEWGECHDNLKKRTCIDKNNCDIAFQKPIEIAECSYGKGKNAFIYLVFFIIILITVVITILFSIVSNGKKKV